jgi:hypothetical protein
LKRWQRRSPAAVKITPESLQKQLDAVRAKLAIADPLAALHLMQQGSNIEAKLANAIATVDMSALENVFVEFAAAYGASKGISYAVWLKAGVSADILKRAGISR